MSLNLVNPGSSGASGYGSGRRCTVRFQQRCDKRYHSDIWWPRILNEFFWMLFKCIIGIEHRWLALNTWRINQAVIACHRNTSIRLRVIAVQYIYLKRQQLPPIRRLPLQITNFSYLLLGLADFRMRSSKKTTVYRLQCPVYFTYHCAVSQLLCLVFATEILERADSVFLTSD